MKTIKDNSRLEELIKKSSDFQMTGEILEILENSRLFLPIVFRKYRDVSDFSGHFGFDIVDIPDGEGNKTVPLFTSSEIAESNPLKCRTISLMMSDLAEILKQSDEYDSVSINPLTENFYNLSLDEFLDIFGIVSNHRIKDIKNEKLREILQNNPDELYCELTDLTLITACSHGDDGKYYVCTYDADDNPYFPLFTDLDEFNKVFNRDGEVYPEAYKFYRVLKFADDNFMINPATESVAIPLKDLNDRFGSFDYE